MHPLVFSTARRDIVFARGSTPRLRCRLTSRNVRTGQLTLRPTLLDVVEWTLLWPAPRGSETKTTSANGGLSLDPASRVVEYPITEADLADIPASGLSHRVAVRNADGRRYRWLEGTITTAGQA